MQPNHDPTAFQQRYQTTLARNRARYLAEANKDRNDWRHIETIYPQLKHTWEYAPNDDRLELIWAIQIYQQLQGLWDDLIPYLKNALLFTSGKNKGSILNNIGRAYSNVGNNEKALHYYKQAEIIRQDMGDKEGYADTLNGYGVLYDSIGKYSDALRCYRQALCLSQEIKNDNACAIILNNMGKVFHAENNLDESLKFYNLALSITLRIGDKVLCATIWNNIGTIYRDTDRSFDALYYFRKALLSQIRKGDKDGEVVTRYNIINTYARLGDFSKVIEQLRQCVRIAETIQSPHVARFKQELTEVEKRLAVIEPHIVKGGLRTG